jgi:membrane protein DedA with SNARE-associated domain
MMFMTGDFSALGSIVESNFAAGIVAAALGAVVSGTISYILQRQSFTQAADERNR